MLNFKNHTQKRFVLTFFMVFCLCVGIPSVSFASEFYPNFDAKYENPDTHYEIFLDDWADLLTDTQEQRLLEVMKPISEYGNVAFVSIDSNPSYDTSEYAHDYYEDHFAYTSGTVFLIDMENRYIWIQSDGSIYDTVTTSYANTITDNSYTYASDGDYYSCAEVAFGQILTLLEGRRISQPMKYISNAFLAVILALLFNYFLAMFLSRSKKASTSQLLSGIHSNVALQNTRADFVRQTKSYSPRSSGSGDRSGGGGGGRSGGGGGHRF